MHTDPNTLLIHLVRDPLSVFDSALNRHDRYSKGKQSITGHAKSWIFYNQRAHALTKKYPERSFSIVFDDLVSDPSEVLSNCCQSLGVEYDTNSLDNMDPTATHIIGNRSRHEATRVKKAPTRPSKEQLTEYGLSTELIEKVIRVAKSLKIRYE